MQDRAALPGQTAASEITPGAQQNVYKIILMQLTRAVNRKATVCRKYPAVKTVQSLSA